VGVCFQSQRAWQHMFAQAGFDVVAFHRGLEWGGGSFRLAIHLLFLRSVSNGHFFLTRGTEGQICAADARGQRARRQAIAGCLTEVIR
jgi:hypothetical protein